MTETRKYYEYTQKTCDVMDMRRAANSHAELGWRVVVVIETPAAYQAWGGGQSHREVTILFEREIWQPKEINRRSSMVIDEYERIS